MLSDAFSFAIPPFDRLTPAQAEKVLASLDLGYFPKGAVVMRGAEATESLYVVLKGSVHERHENAALAIYGPRDSFDAKALFGATDANTFVAAEDTICHLVPRQTLVELARENPPFGEFYQQDITDRLRMLGRDHSNRELAALTMARIDRALVRPVVVVEGTASIRYAAVLMKTNRVTSLLVRDGDKVGIVTGSDMREAVILGGRPVSAPIGPLAHGNLISLAQDAPLFDALVLMIKHNIRRVVIRDGEAITGVIEQVDLLGFLSNHSQVIALRIERARTVGELRQTSLDMLGLVRNLFGTGVKVRYIAELVTELNRKIFRRLFELLAPPGMVENACLLVMGSEGRGEQILKSDQDNALILRDGFDCPDLAHFTAEFTNHLIDFGYPACPGNVMVSNPQWTQPISGFYNNIRNWMNRPDEESQLNLAIFYDAAAVAGDFSLLNDLRANLLNRIGDSSVFFAHFARPTLNFETPAGWLSGLFADRGLRKQVDIKKAAIFPLVHGIRSLALERHMSKTNTLDRLWALCDLRVIDRAQASELADAFTLLLNLRLKARLATPGVIEQTDNVIRLDQLTKAERDQFHDCLSVVRRFKEFISYHFHLGMF
ncbi:CBS domain-containing protein [uncultured Gammaproteobacteria bacterium]